MYKLTPNCNLLQVIVTAKGNVIAADGTYRICGYFHRVKNLKFCGSPRLYAHLQKLNP